MLSASLALGNRVDKFSPKTRALVSVELATWQNDSDKPHFLSLCLSLALCLSLSLSLFFFSLCLLISLSHSHSPFLSLFLSLSLCLSVSLSGSCGGRGLKTSLLVSVKTVWLSMPQDILHGARGVCLRHHVKNNNREF